MNSITSKYVYILNEIHDKTIIFLEYHNNVNTYLNMLHIIEKSITMYRIILSTL